jgi:hypothetical protein
MVVNAQPHPALAGKDTRAMRYTVDQFLSEIAFIGFRFPVVRKLLAGGVYPLVLHLGIYLNLHI